MNADRKPSAFDHEEGESNYSQMAIQPALYCIKNGLNFAEGNVVKYVSRWRRRGGIRDLKKARHYLDMLIEEEEGKPPQNGGRP